ncbi:hypothetical protein GGI08_007767 [Coemansia sp. S2]|nr:hypothetical protein GGI08_007767 [Coemansia sp. S2]
MSRPNRAQANDDYNIGDWYSASRKSRAMSVMPGYQQQHSSHYLQNIASEPLPQYQQPPTQQPTYTKPSAHVGGDNYNGSADQHGQAYHSQSRPRTQQQQRNLAPMPSNAYASAGPYTHTSDPNSRHYEPALPHAPEAQFSSRVPTGYSQRPATASTVGSGHAMGLSFPASLRQSKSRQELLQCYGVSPVAEKTLYLDAPSASAGYVPPARPTTAAVQLSRNKSLKDGYSKRRAGGDSGMGECCGSCCGGCMRCSCISSCCCLSPILSWLLLLLVLVGIALALYFNWGRIVSAVNKGASNTAATPSGVSPALPTIAIDDLVNSATALLAAALASKPAPVPTA